MTAPPQVQAHNFARAIFTDIPNTPFGAGKAAIGKKPVAAVMLGK
jgi:hypothetical protein